MGLTVGQLDAKIAVDSAAFNRDMDAAGIKFGGLAKIGVLAFAAIGAAVIVGLAVATKAAGDYRAKLTQLVTGAGESLSNVAMVGDGMLAMAGKVGQSASALADGMFMIESAGFRGADGLTVLQAAAEGAKVGNASLATTADAVTTVLRDYHMSANQATDATNFLVAVVSQGKVHMEDFAASLAMVLPFASALNVPLDQIGGAMATMTAKGIPAANAATYLKFTMSALANETPKGTAALQSIGLTSEQVASTLTTKGLLPALQLINTQLKDKFPQGGAAMFATLANIVGGTRGLSSALQLTGGNLNDFINSTTNVSNAIKDGHGAVIGWATVQGDLNFQIDAGKAAFEAMAIKLGERLLPPLMDLLRNVIIPLVPQIAAMGAALLDRVLPPIEDFAHWLATLGPDFQHAYDIFSTLTPYIIDVGVAWALYNVALAVTKGMAFVEFLVQMIAQSYIAASATEGMTAAQWLLNIAMDANPIGVVVIAIALLVAAFIFAYQHSETFRNFVNTLWADLQVFASWLGSVLGPILNNIGGFFDRLGTSASQLISKLSHIPGVGGILGYAEGGIVPGPIGLPQLAVVHGGEQVLTPGQQGSGRGGSMIYSPSYYITGVSADISANTKSLLDQHDRDFQRMLRQGQLGGAI
jgi:TP901 family phage tail tape measure protein